MQSDKSPGKDRLKVFYETFWAELKKILVHPVSEGKEKGILSKTQIKAISKVI